jgi:RHS repeat-associated protein
MGVANGMNEYSNFTYNQRGDLTADGTYTYTWNAADQLTAVTADDNSVKVTFAWDGQGRCIEKDVYNYDAEAGEDDTGAWVLNYTRKFVFDGTQLVEELDGNNNPVTGYTWGPQGLMAVTDYTTATPTVYMAVLDGQGNVAQLINSSTGQVAASYTYDPYGALLTATGPAAGVSDVLAKQGVTVREVGLNLFGARFEKWVGIWISEDPTGIAGGSNLFEYCGNDPINKLDATGTAATWVDWAVNKWNSFIDPINAFDVQVRSSAKTLGFAKTVNVITESTDATGDAIWSSVVHPIHTYNSSIDSSAAALGHLLPPSQAIAGPWSAGNWKIGTSYVGLNLVGGANVLEATTNVDATTGNLIDPTGAWNVDRSVHLSAGISQAAFTLAGLKAAYNGNFIRGSFKLAPIQYPKALAYALRRSQQGAAAEGAPIYGPTSSDLAAERLRLAIENKGPRGAFKNAHLAGTQHPNTGVPFDNSGFPKFNTIANVPLPPELIGPLVSDPVQMRLATTWLRSWVQIPSVAALFTSEQVAAILAGEPRIPGLIWDHASDGVSLDLVDAGIHGQTGHAGGRYVTGGRP